MQLDFAFTPKDTAPLRERITRDLSNIEARVRSADPHLRALVLTGGFARGEGTARDDAPVNDYDLVAIRDVPGPGPYARLREAFARLSSIDVDLMPIWHLRLPFVARKLFWLDARIGARVITGDPQALAGLRTFDQVDAGEVPRLLGNRAAGLLRALPGAGETPDEAERDLQATKAVLAAMDSHLLYRGGYAATMVERLRRTVGHPDHSLFQEAVDWKLHGRARAPSWEDARDALLAAVDATGAQSWRDGLAEHVLHALKAGRLRSSPSQNLRRRSWSLLRESTWPDGPLRWREEKSAFFASREQTLQ